MVLTDEQRKRIEENRRRALARLLERRSKQGDGIGGHEAVDALPGAEGAGREIRDRGNCTETVSSTHSGKRGYSSRDTGYTETSWGVVASDASGIRSVGRSLEDPGPDKAPVATATASSPSGSPRHEEGRGVGGAGRARGTRAGGWGGVVPRGAGANARDDTGDLSNDKTGAVSVEAVKATTCEGCAKSGALVDQELLKGFDVSVCRSCKLSREGYQCITKKEAKETYLLPEGTIAVLRFIERDNPHHSSWNKMKLYLRRHVTEYSYKRWGGESGLDAERRRREALKYDRTLARTKGVFKRGKSNHGAAFSSAAYYDDDE